MTALVERAAWWMRRVVTALGLVVTVAFALGFWSRALHELSCPCGGVDALIPVLAMFAPILAGALLLDLLRVAGLAEGLG